MGIFKEYFVKKYFLIFWFCICNPFSLCTEINRHVLMGDLMEMGKNKKISILKNMAKSGSVRITVDLNILET